MGISVKIHNIKGIDDFAFQIPSENGLYALTGENGTGKSTIISCAACSFFNVTLEDYFGKPRENSEIEFKYGTYHRSIKSENGEWMEPEGNLNITGFFEGSIVFGNRFKDVDYSLLKTFSNMEKNKLQKASTFIIENLGKILRDDKDYYSNLYILENKKILKELNLKRPIFFIEKNNIMVSQLNMSTGENLLLTILYSIELRIHRKVYGKSPTFIYLDEIELALHSSSLRRLISFFKEISNKKNFMILFSTHSIDILRQLPPSNIYYLQLYHDGSLDLINPCYPAYAARSLEASTYGFDFLFLVEDILAKQIVERIIQEKRLLSNKRVLVQPIGGWHQVLRYAYDIINTHMVSPITKIRVILDRDIKPSVASFIRKEKIGFETSPAYLPIKSLEKYLLEKLINNVDKALFKELNDYVFLSKSLDLIIKEYLNGIKNQPPKDPDSISTGKALYGVISSELKRSGRTENDLIECVVNYLFVSKDDNDINELCEFLENELS